MSVFWHQRDISQFRKVVPRCSPYQSGAIEGNVRFQWKIPGTPKSKSVTLVSTDQSVGAGHLLFKPHVFSGSNLK